MGLFSGCKSQHSAGGICITLWAGASPEISPSGCLPTTIPLQIPPAETWDLQLEGHNLLHTSDRSSNRERSTWQDGLQHFLLLRSRKVEARSDTALKLSCWEMTRTMGRKPTSSMGQRSWHKCSAESRSLPRSVVRDRRQRGSSSRGSGWPRLPHRPF